MVLISISLQSDGNIEYFINKLQIWETGSTKTIALSFKNLPDRLSRPTALFLSITLRSFNIVSSDTKVNFKKGGRKLANKLSIFWKY